MNGSNRPISIGGGRVTVPPQSDGKTVTVNSSSPGSSTGMSNQSNFTLIRLVVNLVLTKGSPIAPPARLTIDVTDQDLKGANGKVFKLAYWAVNDKKWVLLANTSYMPDTNNPPATGGSVTADFSKVGDPPIGLGT